MLQGMPTCADGRLHARDCPTMPHTPRPPPLQVAGSVALAGAVDPVAALILCTPGPVDLSVINGCQAIRGGRLLTCNLEVWQHQALACWAGWWAGLAGWGGVGH